ncbi:MAG TPA: hypothetical protein VKA98_02520 [Nitrososphaeraceae archaeon]|nr:hypothetical protein [Nitrososphaeraceae archaeon]
MLIKEEEELDNKDETKIFNEKVLQVKGINCDIRIAKISYDQLKKFIGARQHCKMKKLSMKAFFKDTDIW